MPTWIEVAANVYAKPARIYFNLTYNSLEGRSLDNAAKCRTVFI